MDLPVLIDFIPVTELGKTAIEYTPYYRMDASLDSVDETFDRNCIVATLMRYFSPSFELVLKMFLPFLVLGESRKAC